MQTSSQGIYIWMSKPQIHIILKNCDMFKVKRVLTGHCFITRKDYKLRIKDAGDKKGWKRWNDRPSLMLLFSLNWAIFPSLLDGLWKIAEVKVMDIIRFIGESKWMEIKTKKCKHQWGEEKNPLRNMGGTGVVTPELQIATSGTSKSSAQAPHGPLYPYCFH